MSQLQIFDEQEQYENALDNAEAEYRDRRSGKKKPWGEWTRAGWFPAAGETCQCCASVIGPNRGGSAMAYLSHCRGVKHIAALFGVSEKDLRARVAVKKPSPAVDAYRDNEEVNAMFTAFCDKSDARRAALALQISATTCAH